MTGLAPLVTARLHLEPLQPATLEALLSRDTKAAERAQGTSLPDGFFAPTDDFFLEIQLARMRSRPSERAWCARVMVRQEDGTVIGHCGFHGPPADVGRAEIGYMVLPPHRSQGYATEAAQALVDWARTQGERVVFASISPDNVASLAVVGKLGFRQTGVQIDEIDGEEAVYELSL
ncbi:MAG: GNAT family N-acetyltransferase [Acidimicrobiales bacterium]|jgi:RimJ/RimL family protein N-acetyltransferase